MSSSTAQASQLVDGLITSSQSKVVIFSKSTCPFCDRSKGLFESEFPGVGVEVVETDEHPIGDEIRAYLAEKTGQRTVPNIFIIADGNVGNDDLMALYRSEKLAELLADMEKYVPRSLFTQV
ncbi:thioredoxin-like protein [Pterulicium gracile]|uniref:Thioredoxin-like protein n=1 Tax=Pterulicium gracile TaxID=1884261 RepID=A0A5C3QFL9_9AGAR|nr:thioredoxin-like protein [Pterula gracilis]